MNEDPDSSSTRRKSWISMGVTISILIVAVGLMWTAMPKGFKMTHEQIGMGKPALVFVYEPNLVVNISQTEEMNKTRDLLGDQVFFLVAKIGTPDGDKLVAKHHARPSELLLFDRSGRLIKRQSALKSSNELIQWLAEDAP